MTQTEKNPPAPAVMETLHRTGLAHLIRPQQPQPPIDTEKPHDAKPPPVRHEQRTEAGNLERVFATVDGIIDGMMEDYFENKLVRKIPYVQGVIHGTLESFEVEGKKESEVGYKNGQRHGVAKFYQNDVLSIMITFENGIQEGPMVTYHPNGQIQSSVLYKNGKREGPYTSHDAQGRLMQTVHYKAGVLEKEELYDMTGKVVERGRS